MLTKWKISNFKAIRQETELEFKPLTIFAGANSSGKSTVLQSILLVAQSLANEVTNRPIILNGDLVRLGQFDDLRSNNSESNSIGLGWNISPQPSRAFSLTRPASGITNRFTIGSSEKVREIYSEIAFSCDSSFENAEVLQLQPSLANLELKATSQRVDEEAHSSTMWVRQRSDSGDIGLPGHEPSIYSVEFDPDTEEERRSQAIEHKVEGPILRNFLPSALAASFDPRFVLADALLRSLQGEQRIPMSRSFSSILDEPLSRGANELIESHVLEETRYTSRLKLLLSGSDPVNARSIERLFRFARQPGAVKLETLRDPETLRSELIELFSSEGFTASANQRLPLPEEISSACSYLRSWGVNGVKYLGPLRDEPKPVYPLVSNIDPRDVGLKGEHTAAVLHVHRKQIVEYLPADNFLSARLSPERKARSLEVAVSDWLVYLGVAAQVLTKDMGKLGHEMQVRLFDDDPPHDLTHVGVGVSQVLPIVVSCLLAEQDTLLIFEQPELHLHPKVQTLLADFFLAMAMLGKQCILETHSEYLINRLRFRAAAAEGSQLIDTIQIYFAEKKGSESSFRPVVVNEYGAILDWPEGFFDQSQAEAEKIIREATRKRKKQKKETSDG